MFLLDCRDGEESSSEYSLDREFKDFKKFTKSSMKVPTTHKNRIIDEVTLQKNEVIVIQNSFLFIPKSVCK